jgi:hypothetical protein
MQIKDYYCFANANNEIKYKEGVRIANKIQQLGYALNNHFSISAE